MKDLERFCMEEWSKIPPNVFSNLIKHYRNRLSAIILGRLHQVLKTGVPIIVKPFFLVDSIESLIK